jgi:hypothetical protein
LNGYTTGKDIGTKYSIGTPTHKNVGIKYQFTCHCSIKEREKIIMPRQKRGGSCTKEEDKKDQLDKHPRIIRRILFQEIMKKKLFRWVVP